MNRPHMGRGPGTNIPNQGGIPIPGQISRPNANSQSSSSASPSLTVIEMRPNRKNITFECILLDQGKSKYSPLEEPRRTLENNLITTYVAADKSGSIHVVFWGEAGASLKTGDIIRIQGG
ncbi:hypothetical protein BGX34_002632, partial [Mortierella sp. NVP85]